MFLELLHFYAVCSFTIIHTHKYKNIKKYCHFTILLLSSYTENSPKNWFSVFRGFVRFSCWLGKRSRKSEVDVMGHLRTLMHRVLLDGLSMNSWTQSLSGSLGFGSAEGSRLQTSGAGHANLLSFFPALYPSCAIIQRYECVRYTAAKGGSENSAIKSAWLSCLATLQPLCFFSCVSEN